MNYKRLGGLVAVLVGISLIIFARHQQNRVAKAKGTIHEIGDLFENNPVKDVLSGEAQKKASRYDTRLKWILGGGIALVVIGTAVVIFYRRRTGA